MSHPPESSFAREHRIGLMYAFLAYGTWGLLTMYWKWLEWMPSLQIYAHRVVWTVVFIVPLLAALGQWPALRLVLRQRRTMATLCITAVLISINWLGFIWAVNNDLVLQASLGYFINPLLNVLLGVVVLKERLRPAQWLAVGSAAAGVMVLVIWLGEVPWLAFLLAGSFALYSLLRKRAPVSASVGLAVESALMMPFSLLFFAYLGWSPAHALAWGDGWLDVLLVLGAGVVTALPLLWFANAARRLPLSLVGLVQYITPSIQFFLGVFIYQEPFTTAHLIGFALIWLGLAIYSRSLYES